MGTTSLIEKNKYKSKLEEQVAKELGKGWDYELVKIKYTVDRTYTPDFVNGRCYIEVKGYFRNGDTLKYKSINDRFKLNGERFIFCLQYPDKPVRKGSKLTLSGWCDKHGIEWYSAKDIGRIR
jgi:hypothetical protein